MDDKKLHEAVNRSGFPLQIGLATLIDKTVGEHGCKVLYTEHAWRSETGGGFIDLVIEDQHKTSVFVVECKRVLDSVWIFLVPIEDAGNRRFCKAWVSRHIQGKLRYFDWHEMAIDPQSPQSAFCVVDGEDPKARPMLERIAGDVVAATDALAREEEVFLAKAPDSLRMYFSLIVTTAKLKVCTFDPQTVSTNDGKIPDIQSTEVPYVRFHKQLSTARARMDDTSFGVGGLRRLARAKEATVFVVNADHLPTFLSDFEMDVGALKYLGYG